MSVYDYEASFVEVRFPIIETSAGPQPADNFLKVKETLTRIGAPAYNKNAAPGEPSRILWQSCHILFKRQRYWVVHYKELFLLDGKHARTNLTEDDLGRRNAIAMLLQQWGLVQVVNQDRIQNPMPVPIESLKIIPYRDKHLWQLSAKYEIGKVRSRVV